MKDRLTEEIELSASKPIVQDSSARSIQNLENRGDEKLLRNRRTEEAVQEMRGMSKYDEEGLKSYYGLGNKFGASARIPTKSEVKCGKENIMQGFRT